MIFRAIFWLGPMLAWLGLQLAFTRPLRLSSRGTSAFALLFFFSTQKFAWYFLLGGDMFVPELPPWFIVLSDFLYSTSWALLGCTAFVRALECAWKGLRAWRPATAVACAALAAAVAGWGLYEGVRVPRVATRELAFDDLPPAFDGFRVVHLSDFHASPATSRERFAEIVRLVNDCAPDCVCITGDFADGTPEERGAQLEPLRALRAKHGVFGCMGNHEIYSQYAVWRPVFEACGVRMLDDACAVVTNGASCLVVGGVTEPLCKADTSWPHDNVARAFASAPKDAFRILLQHRPSEAATNAVAGVRLQLSGHTHGGAILGLDRLVAYHNDGYLRGVYAVPSPDGKAPLTLHVSPGTGQWAGFPLRLGVPAEITVLTLRRRNRRVTASGR